MLFKSKLSGELADCSRFARPCYIFWVFN